MKKSNLFKIVVALVVPMLLNACFSDPGTDIKLKNVAVVEINEATTSGGADVSKSYQRIPGGPTLVKDSIRVNLVGPQRSSEINVSFAIDPTSTAVAGTHYALISQASIKIPANKSFGFIYFNVLPQNINAGEIWKMKVNLTTADVPVNANYSTFTRSIRISCSYLRSSFVGPYKCLEPGYGTYNVTLTADATDPNTVINSNFWDVGASIKYVFNAAGTVSIPLQTFITNIGAGNESLTVQSQATGTSFDACTGRFVVPYIVRRVSSGATIETNTHTFTKPYSQINLKLKEPCLQGSFIICKFIFLIKCDYFS